MVFDRLWNVFNRKLQRRQTAEIQRRRDAAMKALFKDDPWRPEDEAITTEKIEPGAIVNDENGRPYAPHRQHHGD